ncbi:uncharacterized protein C2845_PM08G22290 [Panicum miliaceum]|uniref:Uncharacterized protein n=1 Tax=Panicum miliaceum TaxID=4540 RepID=A0A3L6QZN7_PANMI|nr:uncharacterized protein C2845_PM08G22290 [Panicum miliaceum]
MDDLLLHSVDAELAAMPNDPIDDANLIRNVQVTTEWNTFREQLANDMFAEYLVRHGELVTE